MTTFKCLINKWTKRFEIFCYSLDIHNIKCQIMVSLLLIHLVNKITCFNFNMLAYTSIIQSKHENTENFGIQSIRWNRKSLKWFRLVSLRELAFEKSKYSTQSGLTSVVVTDISSAERPFVSVKPLVFVAFSVSLQCSCRICSFCSGFLFFVILLLVFRLNLFFCCCFILRMIIYL